MQVDLDRCHLDTKLSQPWLDRLHHLCNFVPVRHFGKLVDMLYIRGHAREIKYNRYYLVSHGLTRLPCLITLFPRVIHYADV